MKRTRFKSLQSLDLAFHIGRPSLFLQQSIPKLRVLSSQLSNVPVAVERADAVEVLPQLADVVVAIHKRQDKLRRAFGQRIVLALKPRQLGVRLDVVLVVEGDGDVVGIRGDLQLAAAVRVGGGVAEDSALLGRRRVGELFFFCRWEDALRRAVWSEGTRRGGFQRETAVR